ncbi:MAG: hypothetical protein JWP20_1364 [Roseomonas sp.]|nr:hypothetical protein [Roseomonas sp.]
MVWHLGGPELCQFRDGQYPVTAGAFRQAESWLTTTARRVWSARLPASRHPRGVRKGSAAPRPVPGRQHPGTRSPGRRAARSLARPGASGGFMWRRSPSCGVRFVVWPMAASTPIRLISKVRGAVERMLALPSGYQPGSSCGPWTSSRRMTACVAMSMTQRSAWAGSRPLAVQASFVPSGEKGAPAMDGARRLGQREAHLAASGCRTECARRPHCRGRRRRRHRPGCRPRRTRHRDAHCAGAPRTAGSSQTWAEPPVPQGKYSRPSAA